jgi:hypothetical protein
MWNRERVRQGLPLVAKPFARAQCSVPRVTGSGGSARVHGIRIG